MIGWHNAGTRTRVPQPILASPGTIVTHIDFLLPSQISGGNPSSSVSVAHQFRVTLKGNCCAAHPKKAENPSTAIFRRVVPLGPLLGRSWHQRWRGARRRVILVAVPVRPRRLATANLPLHHRPPLRPKMLPAMAFYLCRRRTPALLDGIDLPTASPLPALALLTSFVPIRVC